MYKLAPNTTAYVSYVEALEAGEVVGSTYANAGAVLNPFKSRQYELGVKTEQSTWSTTASIFRIERGAVYTNSANARVADGQSIYQGIEIAGSVKLGPQWTLGASAMALDAWYARTANGFDGNRVGGDRTAAAAKDLDDLEESVGLAHFHSLSHRCCQHVVSSMAVYRSPYSKREKRDVEDLSWQLPLRRRAI